MKFDMEGLASPPLDLRYLLLAYVLLFLAGLAGKWCMQRGSAFWQAWGVVMVAYSSLLIILFTFSVPAYAASKLRLSIWPLRVLCLAIAGGFFLLLGVARRRLASNSPVAK